MQLHICLLVALIAGAPLFHVPPARAATKTWNGSATGSWQLSSNWIPAGVPVNGDALVFPATATKLLTTNAPAGPANFASLTIGGEGYVLRGPSLTVTNGLTNAGPVLGVNSTIFAPVQPGLSSTWVAAARATLTLASNLTLSSVTLTTAVAGTLAVDGNINGSASARLVKTGAGRLEINGTAQLGNLDVDAGTLVVDGQLATVLDVASGATLAGVGTVSAFTNAGTLRIGANVGNGLGQLSVTAPGAVVFRPGGSMQVQLQGAGHDQLRVVNPPNLAHGVLTVLRDAAFPISFGQKFVIITNTGVAAFTTTFTNLLQGAFITNALPPTTIFKISYTGGNSNDVELTVVDQIIPPPPASRAPGTAGVWTACGQTRSTGWATWRRPAATICCSRRGLPSRTP